MDSYVSALTVHKSNNCDFSQPGTCVVASPGGGNADCNNGFGGDYTYVVKSYTSDPSQAITGLSIDITKGREHPELGDMANGAAGDYRYVITSRDLNLPTRIRDVQLWRSWHDSASLSDVAAFGWDGISTDINHGRGGSHLYLVWRNVPI